MKTIKTIIKTLIVLLLVITSISNDSFKVQAEPTDGDAYAVLTKDGDFVFFRSYENYSDKSEIVATDIYGHKFEGKVYSNFEHYECGWSSDIDNAKRVYVAEKTIIKPDHMSYWFRDCVNLESFNPEGFDSSNLKSLSNTFANCKSLKTLDLSSFVTDKIEYMDHLFDGCSSLKEIDISGLDTTSVKESSWQMFNECYLLEKITLGPKFVNWEKSPLPSGTWRNGNLRKTETQLANAYSANAEQWAGTWIRDIVPVEDIKITMQWDHSIVLEPGDNVYLRSVIYPENATISQVKWSSSDESIATIDDSYSNWATIKALKYGDVTITVESLDDSKVSDSIILHVLDSYAYAVLQDNGDLVFLRSENVYKSYENTTVTDVNGVKYSGIVFAGIENTGFDPWFDNEFSEYKLWLNTDYNNLIKRVYVAKGNTIYPSRMSGWFTRCKRLESFDGKGFDTYGTTSMSCMFYGCSALKNVDLGSLDTGRIGTFDQMFYHCDSLTELNLSNFDTQYAENMNGMFSWCLSLQKLNINSFNTNHVNEMESMFSNCFSLREIALGPDFTVWKHEAYLPEGTWKNGSLQRTEKQLYSDYPKNANSWNGTWSRDFVVATGLSLSDKKIQILKNDSAWVVFKLKPSNATANTVKVEYDSNLISCRVQDYNTIWINARDQLGSCVVTVSTVDGSNISTTFTVEVVDQISTEINTELTRIYGSNRFNTSMAISDFLAEMKGGKHETVILANGDNFADALAGSYLAAVKNAPIIITRSGKEAEINKYIRSVLKSNGTLYVLGGINAVPESCLSGLDGKGYQIKRLAGNNRYLTNLEILKEAGVSGDTLLIATGTNYADSLSASATGLPMLLVKDSLNDDQKAFLKEHKGMNLIILGGKNAVNSSVEKRLSSYGNVGRISGSNRAETSIMIGYNFFPNTSAAVIAYSHDFPDGLCGGPLAYRLGAPLILTRDADANASGDFIQNLRVDDGYILGGTSRLTDALVKKVFGVKSSTKINEIKK